MKSLPQWLYIVFAVIAMFPDLTAAPPKVIVFCGGRPWNAAELFHNFKKSGFDILAVGPHELDGLAGAKLRTHLKDPETMEPVAQDGITPAFEKLSLYDAVFVQGIKPEFQRKFFTPARVEALKNFVSAGGALVINRDAPLDLLGELAPVVPYGSDFLPPDELIVKRQEAGRFSFMPEKWLCVSPYMPVKAAKGSRVIAAVADGVGSVYAAIKPYGKGKVAFFNDFWLHAGSKVGIRQFYLWAYAPAFMLELTAEASGSELKPAEILLKLPEFPPQKKHDKVTVTVQETALYFDRGDGIPVRESDKKVRFADGTTVSVDTDSSVSIYKKEKEEAVVAGILPASPVLSRAMDDFEAKSGEPVSTEKLAPAIKIVWKFKELRIDGEKNCVEIDYTSDKGYEATLLISHKKASAGIRNYSGVAVATRFTCLPNPLEAVKYRSSIKSAADISCQMMRRMACYTAIRGYKEFDLSGRVDTTVPRWHFYGSGQPFIYIASNRVVYFEFAAQPAPVMVSLDMKKSASRINRDIHILTGVRKSPFTTREYCHMWSERGENGRNDYLAIWQLVRKVSRESVGIKSFPTRTIAGWTGSLANEQEIDLAITSAGKLGFKIFVIPWSPGEMENLCKPYREPTYRKVCANGLLPRPWSAGGYLQGVSEQVFKDHPEWFLKKADGILYGYFNGAYPVADMLNPDFVKWYSDLFAECRRMGLGAVYMDMIGAAAELTNYHRTDCGPLLDGVIDLFRIHSDAGTQFFIEGMNPVATDNYWYRYDRYLPMSGKEFAMIGTTLTTKFFDAFALDFFRLAMYHATCLVPTDSTAIGYDIAPLQNERFARIKKVLPQVNEAFSRFTVPVVSETPFGTLWMEGDRGALFFYDSVKEILVNLPGDWEIEGIKGSILKNVPCDTVVFLKKKSEVK